LGLYISEPQNPDQSGNAPQQIYATKSLTTQKWFLLGDTGSSYETASWYRWFLDPVSKTGNRIVGKTLRSYCSIACNDGSSGEYVDLTITSKRSAPPPVDLRHTYSITSADGLVLAALQRSSKTTTLRGGFFSRHSGNKKLASWYFEPNEDGSYLIVNFGTRQVLGVDSTTTGRAWNAQTTLSTVASSGPAAGQQWFIVTDTNRNGRPDGSFRLVNRYSGLVLSLSRSAATTTPPRSWVNRSHDAADGDRSPSGQTMRLHPSGRAPDTAAVGPIGTQSWTVDTAVSLQVNASSAWPHASLQYVASGLPSGLSINAKTGLISGTPTLMGVGTAAVTVTVGHDHTSRTFAWSVAPQLDGQAVTLTTPGGNALQDPDASSVPDTTLTVGTADQAVAQTWTFTASGSGYAVVNKASGQCMDDANSSTQAGTDIIQWPCSGAVNQQWKAIPASGGTLEIENSHSGLLLTPASDTNGAGVVQGADTGSALQRWTLHKIR
ncbi:MAG: RICIN domain-containing protein, partial [Sciscionella sp.]